MLRGVPRVGSPTEEDLPSSGRKKGRRVEEWNSQGGSVGVRAGDTDGEGPRRDRPWSSGVSGVPATRGSSPPATGPET